MRTKLIMLISKQYSHRQLILLQYRKIREDPRRYQICTHTHTHTHTKNITLFPFSLPHLSLSLSFSLSLLISIIVHRISGNGQLMLMVGKRDTKHILEWRSTKKRPAAVQRPRKRWPDASVIFALFISSIVKLFFQVY